jgi:Tfp pilus assembly protein PilW
MKRISATVFALSIAWSGLAYAHGDAPHILGTVVSSTDTAIVVKTKTGNETVMIDASTKVMRGKKAAALKDVKPGDRVVVHSMKHGDQVMAEEIDLPMPKTQKPL